MAGGSGAKDTTYTKAGVRSRNSRLDNAEKDTVSWWLQEIQNFSLLTHDESTKLFQEYVAGRTLDAEGEVVELTPEAAKIRKKLINANLRLVISIVKLYRNSGLPMEDLIQEGNIGLMKAVERFDWEKGCKFSTYATWWIKQAIGQHVLKRKKTIRLPAHAVGLQRKMFAATEEYKKEFNSEPSAAELASLLGTSERIVKATMQSGRQTISLSAPLSAGNDDSSTVEDVVADTSISANPFEMVAERQLMQVARGVLAELTPKESAILRLRYGIAEDVTDSSAFPITASELQAVATRSEGLQNKE